MWTAVGAFSNDGHGWVSFDGAGRRSCWDGAKSSASDSRSNRGRVTTGPVGERRAQPAVLPGRRSPTGHRCRGRAPRRGPRRGRPPRPRPVPALPGWRWRSARPDPAPAAPVSVSAATSAIMAIAPPWMVPVGCITYSARSSSVSPGSHHPDPICSLNDPLRRDGRGSWLPTNSISSAALGDGRKVAWDRATGRSTPRSKNVTSVRIVDRPALSALPTMVSTSTVTPPKLWTVISTVSGILGMTAGLATPPANHVGDGGQDRRTHHRGAGDAQLLVDLELADGHVAFHVVAEGDVVQKHVVDRRGMAKRDYRGGLSAPNSAATPASSQWPKRPAVSYRAH